MKPLSPDAACEMEIMPKPSDSAAALGNTGVEVVSSPATIGYLEMVCHRVLDANLEDGEATVGIGFNMRHLAAASLTQPLHLRAEFLRDKNNQRFTFKVTAVQNNKTIMTGEHERAIVELDRFLSEK